MPRDAAGGFSAFYLGDEAIIECRSSPGGPARKCFGRPCAGSGALPFRDDPGIAGLAAAGAQLNAISERWRGKTPERGFTMSLTQDVDGAGRIRSSCCVSRWTRTGAGRVLPHGARLRGPFGYTLDLMRHDPAAPNGMTEFLIAGTRVQPCRTGVRRLSMNFAMWGRLFAATCTSRCPSAWRRRRSASSTRSSRSSRCTTSTRNSTRLALEGVGVRTPRTCPVGLLYAGAEGFFTLPGWVSCSCRGPWAASAAPSERAS